MVLHRLFKLLSTYAMAVQAGPRVIVASVIRDLAKHVRRHLPSARVDDINYNPDNFPNELHTDNVARCLQEAEILFCDGDALVTCVKSGATPNLRWAHITWAGVNNVLAGLNFQKPESNNFVLTRTGQGFGELMSEYVVGHIIARERNFAGMMLYQQQKLWDHKGFYTVRPLYTLSIGILGYGAIGKKVAATCKALGMTVWAVTRSKNTASDPNVDQFRCIDALREMLQNCDYICNILPHTPATQDLLSGDILEHCKERKSVLINIGRGTVVSEETLERAIREEWLGGAVLDVFHEEPLPTDSKLWSLPNVVITPHVSGPSLPDPVAKCFADNMKLYITKQPLQNVVDWEKGY